MADFAVIKSHEFCAETRKPRPWNSYSGRNGESNFRIQSEASSHCGVAMCRFCFIY